jgi:molybdenum cofactor guanylyltransferase
MAEQRAGVVLAGGRSSRMGSAKSALEWYGSTLLRRTVSVVGRAVAGPVLVVGAPGQELPELPPSVEVLRDPQEGRGPLQGIAVGLAALAQRADVAFVCSTDLPFLHPAFVRAVVTAVGPDVDVALPVARGYPQPLAAAYRTDLAPLVAKLVAADRLRPAFLFEECRTVRLDDAALRADPVVAALDPDLDSVVNVNEPGEYDLARARPESPSSASGRRRAARAAVRTRSARPHWPGPRPRSRCPWTGTCSRRSTASRSPGTTTFR